MPLSVARLIVDETQLVSDPEKGYYPEFIAPKRIMMHALRDAVWFTRHGAHEQASQALVTAEHFEEEFKKQWLMRYPVHVRRFIIKTIREICGL